MMAIQNKPSFSSDFSLGDESIYLVDLGTSVTVLNIKTPNADDPSDLSSGFVLK